MPTGEEKAAAYDRLIAVLTEIHRQRGDDNCWMDMDLVFREVGFPVPDRRVGDKFAMLGNCHRFVETMCQGGRWQSYAELEGELARLKSYVAQLEGDLKAVRHLLDKREEAATNLGAELVAKADIAGGLRTEIMGLNILIRRRDEDVKDLEARVARLATAVWRAIGQLSGNETPSVRAVVTDLNNAVRKEETV